MKPRYWSQRLGYKLDGPGFVSCNKIFFSPQLTDQGLGSTRFPVKWVSGLFPQGTAAGEWIWPLTSINAEVKNQWSYTSTPPIRFHELDRENFAFTETLQLMMTWTCHREVSVKFASAECHQFYKLKTKILTFNHDFWAVRGCLKHCGFQAIFGHN